MAEQGYPIIGPGRFLIVFYPLYPALIRVFSWIVRDPIWAGLLVSNVTSLMGLYLFYFLACKEMGEQKAFVSFLVLLFFPTAFFFNAAYTEGPFLLFSVGAWYFAREGNWSSAGGLAALAALTRVSGTLLFPSLLVEFYLQKKEKPMAWTQAGWLLFIPFAFGLYLVLNIIVADTPFAFLSVVAESWGKRLVWPWESLSATVIDTLLNPWKSHLFFIGVCDLIAGIGLVVGATMAVLRLRASYATYMVLLAILYLGTFSLHSTPRYMLTAFPLFFLSGNLIHHRRLLVVWLALSLPLLVWFSVWFTLYIWIF